MLAIPAEQAADILPPEHQFIEALSRIRMKPCWAVMLSFAERLSFNFDAATIECCDQLSWIARNSSKPGRPTDSDCWVLQAKQDWTANHWDDPPESIAATLIADLASLQPQPLPAITYKTAHRWKYALATATLDQPFLYDAGQNIGICGDWCLGARGEAAYLSGLQLAEAMLG